MGYVNVYKVGYVKQFKMSHFGNKNRTFVYLFQLGMRINGFQFTSF